MLRLAYTALRLRHVLDGGVREEREGEIGTQKKFYFKCRIGGPGNNGATCTPSFAQRSVPASTARTDAISRINHVDYTTVLFPGGIIVPRYEGEQVQHDVPYQTQVVPDGS